MVMLTSAVQQREYEVGIVILIKFQTNISRTRRHKSSKKNLSQIDETYEGCLYVTYYFFC